MRLTLKLICDYFFTPSSKLIKFISVLSKVKSDTEFVCDMSRGNNSCLFFQQFLWLFYLFVYLYISLYFFFC